VTEGSPLDLSRFLPLFFEEAEEHLEVLERGLMAAESGADPRPFIDDCFRAAHSLKGSAGSLGLHVVVGHTHVLETELDAVRGGARPLDLALAGHLLVGVDLLRRVLDSLTAGGDGQVEGAAEWTQGAVSGAASPVEARPEAARGGLRLCLSTHADTFRCGLDPLPLLRDLDMLAGIVRADLAAIPELDQLDPTTCHLTWTLGLAESPPPEMVDELFGFADHLFTVEHLPDVAAAPQAAATPAVSVAPVPAHVAAPAPRPERATLRIATEKVDRLVDLVGELVISQAILGEVLHELGQAASERVQSAFATLERNTREVQERAMGIRMLPVAMAFDRLPRLVRDLGERLGKRMRVVIEGEETELDRSVLEHLTDPLTHLIRNCADHGIEPAADREAAGKPPVGTVLVRAMHQGSTVIIEVSDDGRGLDYARIRTRAVERGILGAEAALSEAETIELLFAPGFSTADTVSDVSGRGVGMDVVRHSIEALGGRVSMSGKLGEGTSVRMTFPLTLAIVEGLCVRVADTTYVVPMAAITSSFRPNPRDLKPVLGRGELVISQGVQMPLVRLSDVLSGPPGVEDPCRGLLVVVQHEADQAALLVDGVIGSTQAVIKNLERNFQRVEGVMGATILGDGRVALVLDVAGVLRLARRRTGSSRVRTSIALGAASCTVQP